MGVGVYYVRRRHAGLSHAYVMLQPRLRITQGGRLRPPAVTGYDIAVTGNRYYTTENIYVRWLLCTGFLEKPLSVSSAFVPRTNVAEQAHIGTTVPRMPFSLYIQYHCPLYALSKRYGKCERYALRL